MGRSVGRSSLAIPYGFHLPSRFAGPGGTGGRVATRTCDAVFSR